MVKTAKKSASADWEFVTNVASSTKPGEVHRVDRRVAGDQFAFMLHGTPVRCTCKGFVFKTKNGSGEPCRHLEFFRDNPHVWANELLHAHENDPATIPALPSPKATKPIDTFSVDVHAAMREAFGKSSAVLIPIEHGSQWQAFVTKLRLIVSAAGVPTKAALTAAISDSFGATRKRRIVLVD